MFRGMTKFTCDDCGNKFMGMDFEWRCIVYTAPVKCPKCGSMHTYPSSYNIAFPLGGLFGLKKSFYRKIWKLLDEQCKQIDNE